MLSLLNQSKRTLCILCAITLLCTVGILPAAAKSGNTCLSCDANGNGCFNLNDLLTTRKYLCHTVKTLNLTATDLNKDGCVTMKDVLLMRQKLLCNTGDCNTTQKQAVTKTTKTTTKPTKTAVSATYSAQQQEILALVNAERASAGLSPLTLSEAACRAATVRATEVASVFSHTRPNGTSCFTALKEANVTYRTAGENIAKGYNTAESVMNGWMNSAGHKANILNGNFTALGVGYDAASHSWVQEFIG